MQWLETLQENALEIVYRPGSLAAVPDALSRAPHAASMPTTFDAAAEAATGTADGSYAHAKFMARTNVA